MSKTHKCLIVDDEPLAVQLLEAHIHQIPQLEVVATAHNPIDAIKILKNQKIDLAFLDIQMPVLTGIELVKTLQDPPGVIFTTAYRDYAVESYELNVIDYLMKPITFIRFLKAVNKFMDQYLSEETDPSVNTEKARLSTYVNVNKKYVKVVFDKILYIESVKDYIHIHTSDSTIVTKETISNFEAKLPSNFVRIHRSFIVNRSHVTAYTSQDVEIGSKELPIGGSYKERVKHSFN